MSARWRRESHVGLAEARGNGHDIVVVNRVTEIVSDGVTWLRDAPHHPRSRGCAANQACLRSRGREMFNMDGVVQISKQRQPSALDKHRPALMYVSEAQQRGWRAWRAFRDR